MSSSIPRPSSALDDVFPVPRSKVLDERAPRVPYGHPIEADVLIELVGYAVQLPVGRPGVPRASRATF